MMYHIQQLHPTQYFVALATPMASQQTVLQIRFWTQLLQKAWRDKLLEIQIEPRGFLLYFNKKTDEKSVHKTIAAGYEEMKTQKTLGFQSWVFPLCWDGAETADLQQYFEGDQKQIQTYQERFIAQPLYVGFYGFLPGFVYMGGLPPNLHLSRRSEPRLQVTAGSVAVGERYVGIYPQASPGGWQLLGHTPITLFDRDRTPAFFLNPGDRILWETVTASDIKQWQPPKKIIATHHDSILL